MLSYHDCQKCMKRLSIHESLVKALSPIRSLTVGGDVCLNLCVAREYKDDSVPSGYEPTVLPMNN